MTQKDKSTLERATGIIEGIAYCMSDNNIAEGLFNATEMIDSVIGKESEVDTE